MLTGAESLGVWLMRHLAMRRLLAGGGGLQWVCRGPWVMMGGLGACTPRGAYGASQAVAGCQICPCPTKADSGLVVMLGGGPPRATIAQPWSRPGHALVLWPQWPWLCAH